MYFHRPNVSFKVISNSWDKPRVLEEFVKNPLLKCDVKPNPILQEMLDKAISTRSIPLHNTEYTMNVIKSKYPDLSKDVNECLEILKSYHGKV